MGYFVRDDSVHRMLYTWPWNQDGSAPRTKLCVTGVCLACRVLNAPYLALMYSKWSVRIACIATRACQDLCMFIFDTQLAAVVFVLSTCYVRAASKTGAYRAGHAIYTQVLIARHFCVCVFEGF